MSTGAGRPRRACSTCKSQKIRCTGERPSCKRCLRLKHSCVYSGTSHPKSKTSREPAIAPADDLQSPATPATGREERNTVSNERQPLGSHSSSIPAPFLDSPAEDTYLGIPRSLVLRLVDVYFDNIYNANLLLHKRLFLESLEAGTVRHHVVLSVCAWGANFYQDANGRSSLKEHGFMIEWAQRAGKLVFQEAEQLYEENIVTFCNLCLFWLSQGSWRLAYLHKGSACNLLRITGIGLDTLRAGNSLQCEIRRRRLWACYLMHTHNSEGLMFFEPMTEIWSLPLPWPEGDYDIGASTSPLVSLHSGGSNAGVFGELIKALTFWASVVFLTKSPDASSLSARISAIHALDERLSVWWKNMTPGFKLTSSNFAAVPRDALPKILLLNLVYHQSLCALHASIVPLFCWGASEDSWSSARQVSAQVAYEHACAASELISVTLSTFDRLSAMPSFIPYAAYSGCAIQIPFMWSTNPIVRERAHRNVRTNIKMIHTMAIHWKFAALLKIHVRCLYNIYKEHPTTLEDEPKSIDVEKLTNFKISAPHARASILQFIGVLFKKGRGVVKPGEEERDLGIEDSTRGREEQPQASGTDSREGHGHSPNRSSQPQIPNYPTYLFPHPLAPAERSNPGGQYRQEEPLFPFPFAQTDPFAASKNQNLDIVYPTFDPQMFDLLLEGDMPDLSQFETSPWSLDYFEFDNWNGSGTEGSTAMAGLGGDEGDAPSGLGVESASRTGSREYGLAAGSA